MSDVLHKNTTKTQKPTISDEALLDLVEREIAARQKDDGISFHVRRNEVEHVGNWTHIMVLPEPADVRVSRYTATLGEVEDAIKKQTNVKLLLVPAMPN